MPSFSVRVRSELVKEPGVIESGRSLAALLRLALTSIFLGTLGALSPSLIEAEEEFWSFRQLNRPSVPSTTEPSLIRTPVDAFLLAKLHKKNLCYAEEADRVTLLRRVYFDLVGLPPTLEDVEAFLRDKRFDAYERVVDRLLASPRFGERWGRHWLDVVGYVDTIGFDVDENNIILADGKWRYRDYVIQAFNDDKPYDEFITEQLCGDEMIEWREVEEFTPRTRELLIATGYLRTAQDFTHEPESNNPSVHFMVLHDTVEIVSNSLLAVTLNCARCHDHKFDPFEQEEYYQFQAFFTPAYNPKDWKPVYPYNAKIGDRALATVSPKKRAVIDRANGTLDRKIDAINKTIAELRGPYEERVRDQKIDSVVPKELRADAHAAFKAEPEKRTKVQKFLVDKFNGELEVSAEEAEAAFTQADQKRLAGLKGEIAQLDEAKKSYGKIQALYDVGPPPSTHFLRRGNFERPGREVDPGFLTSLGGDPDESLMRSSVANTTSGRRTTLARWLTRPDSRASALLARVMVNRVWQHVFGAGIVRTPGNFGTQGARPSHPKLLDWLAGEFSQRGWSVKSLVRMLVTSRVYRQTTQSASQSERTADPENLLLWHMPLRRLESEAIRDAVLATSGNLDLSMGGPPVLLKPEGDGKIVIDEDKLKKPTDKFKRSVYLLARRGFHLSMLGVFDQPSVTTNCSRRDASAVPLQSLTMLNDKAMFDEAENFAERVNTQAGDSTEAQIVMAFRLALARRPNDDEVRWCEELLDRQRKLFASASGELSAEEAQHKALAHLCHTILNTSEFLYAE